MHTLLTCGDDPPNDVAYDVHDGWVVIAKTQDVVSKVEAATARASLADDATYQKWTKALGDAGVFNLYAAPAAGDYLATHLADLQGAFAPYGTETFGTTSSTAEAVPSAFHATAGAQDSANPFAGVLKDFQGAAATVRFTGDGLELATAADSGLARGAVASDQGGAVVSRLPADTAAAIGFGLKPGWVTTLADQFASSAGSGQTGQQLLDQLSRESGLDLPADAETLVGTSSALSISKTFDFESLVNSSDGSGVPIAFTVRGNPAEVEKVLAKLRDKAGPQGTTVLGSDSSGDLVAVGPTQAYRQAVLSGGTLGSTDAFTSVVPEADRAGEVFFVNLDDLEHAISQASGDDRSVTENVAPLQALGFSTWMDGDALHASLQISTN